MYLVPQPLAGDYSHFIAYSLVGLEVEGETGIVPLNDDLGGLLDGLGANATHDGESTERYEVELAMLGLEAEV
jgi:hypothetical protein